MKVFSAIAPEFREELRKFPVKIHQQLNEWITIKKVENDGDAFYFTERNGIDSVAFILFDKTKEKPFGLLKQYRTQHGQFLNGAYTGSLDKPELSIEEIVVEEALEEAGYTVTTDQVHFVSKEYVGSMSNECVNLFLVDVSGIKQGELQPESEFELNTENLWVDSEGLLACDDWKAKLIFHAGVNK